MCNCNPTSSTSDSSVITVGGGGCGTCQNGEDGASAYTYVAFADTVTDQCNPAYDTTGFSLTANPTSQWVAFITTTSPLTPPTEADFDCAWVQIAGSGVGPAGLIEVQENGTLKVTDPNILNFIESGIVDINITSVPVGSNTKADIVIDASIFEKITLANAQALLSAGTLEPGRLYWIYDVGDAATPANGGLNNVVTAANAYAGIIIKAIDVDKFESTGAYIARLTLKQPFWHTQGMYVQNSTVEHLNAAYRNPTVAQAAPSNIPPSANPTVWQRVSKEDSVYYSKVFSCVYDVASNQIYSITDQRNNTVTLTSLDFSAPFTAPANELFYYCFRWTEDASVYNNKITVSGVSAAQTGFYFSSYPKLAMPAVSAFNSAFWSYAFYDNTINLDFGKYAVWFNASKPTAGSTYPSFYAGSLDEPTIHNNLINCTQAGGTGQIYVNHYIEMCNNTFQDCKLGTASTAIISTHAIYPLGELRNCNLVRTRVITNTGSLESCNLTDAEVLRNTDLIASHLNGFLEVSDNTKLEISNVTAFTRAANSSLYNASRIYLNYDVYIFDVIGDRFNINNNETVSISINVRLYNANIRFNTFVGDINNFILFDTDGKTAITVSSTNVRKSCAISQVELRNFSNIEYNEWHTAGGIARCTLTGSDIKYMSIDFRDPAWIAAGGPTPPVPIPPLLYDFNVNIAGSPEPVYLFQSRNKITNPNYPFPAAINEVTLLSSVNIDGNDGSNNTTVLPLRNAYTFDGSNWNYLPFISDQSFYANGVYANLQGGQLYAFLDVGDTDIYNPATDTLTIPSYAQHASILYLYDKNNDQTIVVQHIVDNTLSTIRPIHNFRIVALSYGLTVNITTTALASAANTDIVSSYTPGPGIIGIFDRFDILDIEKRDYVYYVTNWQSMQ